MPLKKIRLSRQEQANYVECAQQLQAYGLDCGNPRECQTNPRSLDIRVARPEGNILCELSSGVTAYAIWVRLVALRSNLILEYVSIESELDSESIALCGSKRGFYRVGHAVDFTEEEVLNHRIEEGLHFRRRGERAEGWLIATGCKQIPDRYRDRMICKISLVFTDQFGCDHSAHSEAILERTSLRKDFSFRGRTSPSLFERSRAECQSARQHNEQGAEPSPSEVPFPAE